MILVHSGMLPIYREVHVSILGAWKHRKMLQRSSWLGTHERVVRKSLREKTGYYSRPSKRVVGRKLSRRKLNGIEG